MSKRKGSVDLSLAPTEEEAIEFMETLRKWNVYRPGKQGEDTFVLMSRSNAFTHLANAVRRSESQHFSNVDKEIFKDDETLLLAALSMLQVYNENNVFY
jgi:hypothetical protein